MDLIFQGVSQPAHRQVNSLRWCVSVGKGHVTDAAWGLENLLGGVLRRSLPEEVPAGWNLNTDKQLA